MGGDRDLAAEPARAVDARLAADASELLARLIRFDTVNPPGKERALVKHLRDLLAGAGFECELLAAEPERPNLIARLRAEGADATRAGQTLCYLGHVDTVLADPREWSHDPWSGELVGGCLWGRGALDMKSQVAAEVAAVISLARSGWRPARGELLLVAVVDEETGGELGARWLCAEHPERVRCDLLVNEGGGPHFELDGRRLYPVCCAEKGVFRFTVTAGGAAGHASMPRLGENALLRLAPALARFAERGTVLAPTEEGRAFLRAIGEDAPPGASPSGGQASDGDLAGALTRLGERDPRLLCMFEPMFGVTFSPTMISASEKINVIPSRAELRVDCRVPPGLGERETRAAIEQVLGGIEGLPLRFARAGAEETGGAGAGKGAAAGEGAGAGAEAGKRAPAGASAGEGADAGEAAIGAGARDGLVVEFTETVIGNGSPPESPLVRELGEWIAERDPGATVVPTTMPGFTDSHHFRAAFPDCLAYGFFPQRHQSLLETHALMHAPDERIDVRDLALAAACYRDLAPRLLGSG